MNFQYSFSALNVRIAHKYLSVKSARTKKCRVKYITSVCCSHNNNRIVILKAVHFNKKLVKGLLTLVMTAAKACASLSAHCVDLVYKDDSRSVFLSLLKKISYS